MCLNKSVMVADDLDGEVVNAVEVIVAGPEHRYLIVNGGCEVNSILRSEPIKRHMRDTQVDLGSGNWNFDYPWQ